MNTINSHEDIITHESAKLESYLKEKKNLFKIWHKVKYERGLFTTCRQLYKKLSELMEIKRKKYTNIKNDYEAFTAAYDEVFTGKERFIKDFKLMIHRLFYHFDKTNRKEPITTETNEQLFHEFNIKDEINEKFGKRILYIFDDKVKKYTDLKNGVLPVDAIDHAIEDILAYNKIYDKEQREKYTELFKRIAL